MNPSHLSPLVTLPPSVLASAPAPHLSSRYAHVNSHDIVRRMADEGFELRSVTARRTRSADSALYAKHVMDFRHPDAPQYDGVAMRVLVTNAHDGSASARAIAGAFRFICSNGLVIGTTVGSYATRHVSDAADAVIRAAQDMARRSTTFVQTIDRWDAIELSADEAIEFARGAAMLRFGDVNRFDPRTMLATVRAEDEGRSLWRVFNRVQEATTNRRLTGFNADGRRLASSPLASVDRTIDYNAQLWSLAEEFAE